MSWIDSKGDKMNTKEYWNTKWDRIKNYHDKEREELFFELQQYLKNKVLDIGCGDGMLGKPQGSRYHGIDFSEEAIKKAKANCPHGTFYIGDIKTVLPFKYKTFDTVVLNAVLEHFIDFELILQEARRITKNWIVIIVPYNSRGSEHSWPSWSVEYMIYRLHGLGECIEARKFKHWIIGVYEV